MGILRYVHQVCSKTHCTSMGGTHLFLSKLNVFYLHTQYSICLRKNSIDGFRGGVPRMYVPPVQFLSHIFTTRKWSLGQGNIFAPVCHSVHRGEYLGRYTPSLGRYISLGRYPLQAGTPPGRYTPQAGSPPTSVHAGIRSTSGRYAFYWNAFLFIQFSGKIWPGNRPAPPRLANSGFTTE